VNRLLRAVVWPFVALGVAVYDWFGFFPPVDRSKQR
jgi:hypothetical protein